MVRTEWTILPICGNLGASSADQIASAKSLLDSVVSVMGAFLRRRGRRAKGEAERKRSHLGLPPSP